MKSIAILNAFALCVCLAAAASAQEKEKKHQAPVEIPMEQQIEMARKVAPMRGGPDFYIEPIAGPHINYSILITDTNHRSVPGTFIRQQIEIFEELLVAAKTFAQNEEEVGPANKPKITRFMDKHEKSFIIDVAKGGDKSHFYVTMESLFGRLTLDAGVIKRGVKKPGEEEPEPLYYKIIARVQEAKNAPPPIQQSQQ